MQHCERHGLYAILDFHALPGAQNQHWHSDNGTHRAGFWSYRHFQDRAVHLWEAIAGRFRGNPAVAGYNLMNEPGDPDGTVVKPFYDRAVQAVRAVDPGHIIFLDGNRYSTDFSIFEGAPLYENTVYAAHDYALPGFVFGGPYPGETQGVYVDRAQVERTRLKRTEFMRATGAPIWIGEFGPLYTGDAQRGDQRYRLLQDQLAIYAEHGASWTGWPWTPRAGCGSRSGAATRCTATHPKGNWTRWSRFRRARSPPAPSAARTWTSCTSPHPAMISRPARSLRPARSSTSPPASAASRSAPSPAEPRPAADWS